MRPPLPGHATVDDTPLRQLAALQRSIGDGCDRLLELAASDLDGGERQRRVTAACHLLDQLAPRLHALERTQLHPALIESMAGSDPVCLREITAALDDGYRQLQRRWQALRPGLLQRNGAAVPAIDTEALRGLARGWRAHLVRQHAELLPMAERLLDDAAQAAIGHALEHLAAELRQSGECR